MKARLNQDLMNATFLSAKASSKVEEMGHEILDGEEVEVFKIVSLILNSMMTPVILKRRISDGEWISMENEEDEEMENKKWYAVQTDRTDDWGTGSYDYDEAVQMLKEQGYGLIAVIDEGSNPSEAVCVEEIEFDSLDDDTEYYYWLDTTETWNSPRKGEAILIRGQYNEDGEKDRETEEEILKFSESDCGIIPDDSKASEKVDAYIEKELGFLPDYEVN